MNIKSNYNFLLSDLTALKGVGTKTTSLLKKKRIAHAALDVFGQEPIGSEHPFLGLDNVTLTAHAGFMTKEASTRLLRMGLDTLAQEISSTYISKE